MKIDMMAMVANSFQTAEIKSSDKERTFLSILSNETEWDKVNLGNEEKTDMDELVALMSSMLNNLTTNRIFNDDISKINEVVESMDTKMLGDTNTNKFQEFLKKDENEQLLEALNINLEEFIYENKKIGQNLIFEVIKKINNNDLITEYINKNTELQDTYNIQFQNNFEDNMDFIDYKDICNQGEERLVDSFSFEHRKILKNEEVSKQENEINILNRIAFSISDVESTIKATETLLVKEQSLGEDIIKIVKYMSNNRVEELNVKMSPKDLGDINIKYLKRNGESRLIITLSQEDTFSLVNENINEIKNHLINFDVKSKGLVVEVSYGGENDFSDSLSQQFNKNNQREEKGNRVVKRQSNNEDERSILDDTNINLLI